MGGSMHHTIRRVFPSLWSFIVTLAFCLIIVDGQTITGRISGTVRDKSNDVLPGATVVVVNEATQITHTAITDESGFYVITNLPPSDYTVTIEHRGFKKAITKN